MARILVVEDDYGLLRGIEYALSADKHLVSTAKSMKEAFEKVRGQRYDLITLDINLPDGDGFEICRKLKAESDVPVIFLTARDLDIDQESGFNLGADDYITKPFNMNIFRKRVLAVLRRYKRDEGHLLYDDGDLRVDFGRAETKICGKELEITPTEYKLLKLFVSNPGQVLTRGTILEQIWDNEGNYVDEHALTVNINRLRGKIATKEKNYIKTVYGMGYMWMGGEQV